MRLAQGAFEELADAALGKVRGFADLLQGKPLLDYWCEMAQTKRQAS